MLKALKRSLMRFVVIALVVQASLIAAWLPFGTQSAKADGQTVIINEVMWMGSVGHITDEWVELKNLTDQAVDISGWQIENSGVSAFDEGTTIPADGFFLISNYGLGNASTILNTQADIVTTSISLDNTCSTKGGLLLKDEASTIVDSATCVGSNWPAGLNSATKSSMERDLDGIDWHSSVGSTNLIESAVGSNFATPGAENIPSGSITLRDGNDVYMFNGHNYTVYNDELLATWNLSGLTSDLTKLEVSYSNSATVPTVGWLEIDKSNNQYAISVDPLLVENQTYYYFVRATYITGDVVNLTSDPIEHKNPFVPTSLAVTELSNYATLTWDNVVADGYRIGYRVVGGDWSYTTIDNNFSEDTVTYEIPNWLDGSKQFEFSVQSISTNTLYSGSTTIKDSLPSIHSSKINVLQNKPGNNDYIEGQIGAVTDIMDPTLENIWVDLYDQLPVEGVTEPIDSVKVNADGSFNQMNLGDNEYAEVYLQAVNEITGKISESIKKTNDIVAPNIPVISKVDADCALDDCRVAIEWTEDSTDAVSYNLQYSTDGEVRTIQNLTTKSAVLSLDSGKVYEIVAYAIDGAGNRSDASQLVRISLVQGVNITGRLVNGEFQITTSPVSGTLEEVQAAPSETSFLSPFVPAASAQGNNSTTPSPTPTNQPSEEAKTESSQWSRILIGALLLLVVAGSFYALSRTIGKDEEIVTPPPSEKPKEESPTPQNKKNKKKRR